MSDNKSCFDLEMSGKSRLHWIVWLLVGLSILLFVFGLVSNELTFVSFKGNPILNTPGLEFQFSCGATAFNSLNARGYSDQWYTKCNEVSCKQQASTGVAWISLACIASISLPLMIFAIYKDNASGNLDGRYGMCAPSICACLGLFRMATIWFAFWEFWMIVGYWIGDRCVTEKFWGDISVASTVSEFKSLPGISIVFAVLSWIFIISVLIILGIYQCTVDKNFPKPRPKKPSGELPNKPKKKGNEKKKESEEKKEEVVVNDDLVPKGDYFRPQIKITGAAENKVDKEKQEKKEEPPQKQGKKQIKQNNAKPKRERPKTKVPVPKK